MLTFLPVFLQSGLGNGPQKAGLLMLPIAIPLIVMPRIVATYLVYRFSGRALLTIGLLLIAVGLAWIAARVPSLNYISLLEGMLVAGCGAGILNGEIAKVGMAVIPPERAGMASGVSGTARFSGIVVGFAALGAVLFAVVSQRISNALPTFSPTEKAGFIRSVAAGDLNSTMGSADTVHLHELALHSFAGGYQVMIFTAAALAACAAMICWLLVRYSETMPLSPQLGRDAVHLVAPVE
jgi:nitrate/nitrite transporter NarK